MRWRSPKWSAGRTCWSQPRVNFYSIGRWA